MILHRQARRAVGEDYGVFVARQSSAREGSF